MIYNIHLSDFFNLGWKIKVINLKGVEKEIKGLNDIYFEHPFYCWTDDEHINDDKKEITCFYYRYKLPKKTD